LKGKKKKKKKKKKKNKILLLRRKQQMWVEEYQKHKSDLPNISKITAML
jgi:hypothetical protein